MGECDNSEFVGQQCKSEDLHVVARLDDGQQKEDEPRRRVDGVPERTRDLRVCEIQWSDHEVHSQNQQMSPDHPPRTQPPSSLHQVRPVPLSHQPCPSLTIPSQR